MQKSRSVAVRDWCLSAASLVLLLIVLMSINDPVRERVSSRLSTKPSVAISQLGNEGKHLVGGAATFVRDQTLDHTPMVAFATVGIVLLVVMLRS